MKIKKTKLLPMMNTNKNCSLGNSLKKHYNSMPNMAFMDYEFGIKSPNSTIITTEEPCLQKEIDVESDGLAVLKDLSGTCFVEVHSLMLCRKLLL